MSDQGWRLAGIVLGLVVVGVVGSVLDAIGMPPALVFLACIGAVIGLVLATAAGLDEE